MDKKFRKTRDLHLRLSESDRRQLERLAAARGSDLSKTARELLAHGLREQVRELERVK